MYNSLLSNHNLYSQLLKATDVSETLSWVRTHVFDLPSFPQDFAYSTDLHIYLASQPL